MNIIRLIEKLFRGGIDSAAGGHLGDENQAKLAMGSGQ